MGRVGFPPDLGVMSRASIPARDLDGDAGELADVLEGFDKGGDDNDLITAAGTTEF
jgi:hypothetical protein